MTAAGHSEALEISALEKKASWASGSVSYLVSTKWWHAWTQYSGYTGPSAPVAPHLPLPGGGAPRPGPVSNTNLLPPNHKPSPSSSPTLPVGPPASSTLPAASPAAATLITPETLPIRPNLLEQQDFIVVSEASWRRLQVLYGGGPTIARRVVCDPPPGPSGCSHLAGRWTRVVLYPLRLQVVMKGAGGRQQSTVVAVEPEATLATLKQRACVALGVSETDVVLWDYAGGASVRSLEALAPGEGTSSGGELLLDGLTNNGIAASATGAAANGTTATAAATARVATGGEKTHQLGGVSGGTRQRDNSRSSSSVVNGSGGGAGGGGVVPMVVEEVGAGGGLVGAGGSVSGGSGGGATARGSATSWMDVDIEPPAPAPPPVVVAAAVAVAAAADGPLGAVGSGSRGGTGGGSSSGGSVVVAGGSGGSYLNRTVREAALLDAQMLLLRRKDEPNDEEDDDNDACALDNDLDVAPPAKAGNRKLSTAATDADAANNASRQAPDAAGSGSGSGLGLRLSRGSGGGASGTGGGGGGAVASGVSAPLALPAIRTNVSSSGGGASGAGGSGTGVGTGTGPSRLGQKTAWSAWDDTVLQRDGQAPGLAGLTNLGNTCFMNSSLQCLAHAVPLMGAFLGGNYRRDLNRINPLGMKGALAEAFGSLMEMLWRGDVSAVTPRGFKAKIGRFAPQFSGYAQHDSQEFLAFLLDGLHEDTNRIHNKPYIEEKDQPGRPDSELAAEAWANYRARNNSLVVDHFQGLFKSRLDCPQCGFNSVKFDPFMYLSLPLPESRRRVVEVVLVTADGSAPPQRLAVELASGASVGELVRGAAEVAALPAHVRSSPKSHLLPARPLRPSPTATTDELMLLTDPRARLADVIEAAGGGSSYSLRSSTGGGADPALILYYYPDPGSGPLAPGLSPVVVHFKRPDARRTSTWAWGLWCGAPLLLYMPSDRPPYDPEALIHAPAPGATPSTPSSTSISRFSYVLPADAPLVTALTTVLRPIKTQPLVPAAQPPASVGSEGPQPQQPTVMAGGKNPITTPLGAVRSPTAISAAAAATTPAAAAVAAGGIHGSADGLLPGGSRQPARSLGPCRTTGGGGSGVPPPLAAQDSDPGGQGPMEEDDVAPAAAAAAAGGAAAATTRPSAAHGGGGARALPPKPHSSSSSAFDFSVRPEDLRPQTPVREGDHEAEAIAASAAPSGHCSDAGGGDIAVLPLLPVTSEDDVGAADGGGDGEGVNGSGNMDVGLEPLVVADQEPAAAAAAAEDEVMATPPAVILMGPPEGMGGAGGVAEDGTWGTGGGEGGSGGGLGPPAAQPFDMWAEQPAAAPVAAGSASGALAPPSGPPFTLRLCTAKGDPTLWGSTWDKDIDKEQHREFLLTFSEACCPAPGVPPGPYSPELLDSPAPHPSLTAHRARTAAGPQPVNLADCMNTFLQPERLAESDAWYCPRCKAHVCADKKLDLWSLPEVLVVHLKRFCYTRYSRTKLDTRVDFPLHGLDLGPYVLAPQAVLPLYDLFAVSNHYGSMGGGHYTAYAKLPSPPPQEGVTACGGEGDCWYCFDDSHVSPVASSAVRSPAAYVLFYRRRAEAAADPPDLTALLGALRETHAACLRTEEEEAAERDGPHAPHHPAGVGSPDAAGPNRLTDPDQDQDTRDDQRRPYGNTTTTTSGGGGGAVSLAAAAEAARVARARSVSGVEVAEEDGQGASSAAGFSGMSGPDPRVSGRRHDAANDAIDVIGRHGKTSSAEVEGLGPPSPEPTFAAPLAGLTAGKGIMDDEDEDLYGSGRHVGGGVVRGEGCGIGGTGSCVAAPSSPEPASVGNTVGSSGVGGTARYDEDLYDAYQVDEDDGGSAGGGGGGIPPFVDAHMALYSEIDNLRHKDSGSEAGSSDSGCAQISDAGSGDEAAGSGGPVGGGGARVHGGVGGGTVFSPGGLMQE